MKKNNVSKINKYNILAINIQVIFTVLAIIFVILYLFNNIFEKWYELFIGIDFLILAYNNYWTFRRKKFTLIYIICGVVLLLISIFNFLGVSL